MSDNNIKQKQECYDGNKAATYVAYAMSELAFIYPITPSSAMAEQADIWANDGRKNCMGNVLSITQMQSECGAAGALHGASNSGALVTTFTASQGFLLMIPDLYRLAGECLPAVLHVASRQVAHSVSSIFGEHSDVMAARSTGAMMLSSHCVQDVHDLGLVAHMASLKASLPCIHWFDGFHVSHELAKISVLPYDAIYKYLVSEEDISKFRARASHPSHPTLGGCLCGRDTCFQAAERPNSLWDAAPAIVQECMDKVAAITGRPLKIFEYVGADDADTVVICMGAGSGACIEAAKVLGHCGVVRVHLFRPWSPDSLLNLLVPLKKTLKSVVVLDRTKDGGSLGEPLFLDVLGTFAIHHDEWPNVRVIGGRFGLGDKAFTSSNAVSVFEHGRSGGFNGFTVGLDDDVTKRSLPRPKTVIKTVAPGTKQCILWGFGSDGTVGATKSAVTLIADNTPNYVQGYFLFTAHKSGGVTISHVRFGPHSFATTTYPIDSADYVACHHPSYALKYAEAMTAPLAPGGIFCLNWPGGLENIATIPNVLKVALARKNAKLYIVDARAASRAAGLGGHIVNVIMQVAFFKLAAGDAIGITRAVGLLKDAAAISYKKKGPDVVRRNYDAIDGALTALKEAPYDAKEWEKLVPENLDIQLSPSDPLAPFVKNVKQVVDSMNGESLPVSAFEPGCAIPTSTTRYEKRGVGDAFPKWDSSICIQCATCAAVCPHAAIRSYLVSEEEMKNGPKSLGCVPAKGIPPAITGDKKFFFKIQVSPADCTGCGVCVSACPAKGAITMHDISEIDHEEYGNWDYLTGISSKGAMFEPPQGIKQAMLKQPLFEFSGACAGCGETAHMKLLTQLFGERVSIANAPGCSSAVSVSYASTPYARTPDGFGPSMRTGLFENNAEYGYGQNQAQVSQRLQLVDRVSKLLANEEEAAKLCPELKSKFTEWLAAQNKRVPTALAKQIREMLSKPECAKLPSLVSIAGLKDSFCDVDEWIIGGDGWSYDINSGGLEHVLSLQSHVRVLILDTEVYSNTGGQVSKATPQGGVHKFCAGGKKMPKKNLPDLLMALGHVYVATIAINANPAQALRAFQEADSYDKGPAVVIAYCPCIEHGIEGGSKEFVNASKLAVATGYWPLFRYNPAKAIPLELDSPDPKKEVSELLAKENRFLRMSREHPEQAKEIQAALAQRIAKRWENLKAMAQKK